MLPDPGQAALAVEARAEVGEAVAALALLDHAPTRREVEAERGLLEALGGGCEIPLGVLAVAGGEGAIRLRAVLYREGGAVARVEVTADTPAAAAALAAKALMGR
jgi:hydroxymethylbilane synthase